MSNKTAAVLATLTAGAITYALENVEAFRTWMVETAEAEGQHDVAEAVPDVDGLTAGLAIAGMSVISAAEGAAGAPDIEALVAEMFADEVKADVS